MNKLKVKDGTEIYYKDWGRGQPIVFHHGWPLSSDEWDPQMMFFLSHGFRVIAFDRRGHGRSSQSDNGHEMDTYASDVAELVVHLKLENAIHIGHSTGGGEAIRYAARYGGSFVAMIVLIGAVTPLLLKTDNNPHGAPIAVFDDIRYNVASRRQEFYRDITFPFYGFNRDGANVSEGIRDNWWHQAIMGSVKAHYDGVKAFSETDFTQDLEKISVPVLVLHGEDDQIVPFQLTAPRTVKLLSHAKLISYPGFPHGMPTTHASIINADILAFVNDHKG